MQIPKRKAQKKYSDEDESLYFTSAAIDRMKQELDRLEHKDRPSTAEEVAAARALGDLSENAEYQDAKARLGRINTRIFYLQERLKHAIRIEEQAVGGPVQIGSTVTVESNGTEKRFQILGTHESNPSRGRISHVSPLGAALLDHVAGEMVVVKTEAGEIAYKIKKVE
ncbi:MAG TPA: transcription elongation factor GreA [Patescibacteria group bacterium]|nr:transcription elongation factor GreA [Patescibacteria group bacterium]